MRRHCHVGEGGRPGSIGGVSTATPSYKGHRYPVEIINHCVWLYFRFPLSFREVEELMLARGVAVSYETIRRWCAKFGQAYANGLRQRAAPAAPAPRRQVAPRRSVRQDQRTAALPVACGRPALQRLGCAGDLTAKRRCGQAVLPQTAHGSAILTSRADHRQNGQLPGRAPRTYVVGGPPAVAVSEQPRRELPSAHQTTRAGDETLHLGAPCATIPVGFQRHLRTLPAQTPSAQRDRMASRDG